jgi:hypothetical protein
MRVAKLSRLAYLGGACAIFMAGMVQPALATLATVPELDPGTAGTGLAVLAGAILLLVERYRRR